MEKELDNQGRVGVMWRSIRRMCLLQKAQNEWTAKLKTKWELEICKEDPPPCNSGISGI